MPSKTKLVLTSSIITFVCVLQVLLQFLSVLHTHMHMECLWHTNTCNNNYACTINYTHIFSCINIKLAERNTKTYVTPST